MKISNFWARLLSGIIYIIIIFFGSTNYGSLLFEKITSISTPSKYWLLGLIWIFSGFCIYEIIKMFRFQSKIYPFLTVVLSLFLLYYFSNLYLQSNQELLHQPTKSGLMVILFIICLITIFRFTNEIIYDNSKLIVIISYIILPFGLALSLPNISFKYSNGLELSLILVSFILIWSSDTFAYVFGNLFGKHKMAPTISPNKSWEGFFGGFICTLILGALLIDFHSVHFGIVPLIAIFAPIGDLAISKLKRFFQVKDTSNLIPGHGGFLDRLDSFICIIPIIFAYYLILNIFTS